MGSLTGKPAWFPCVRPHDRGPAPDTDVQGRDGVGRASEPARHTFESGLPAPVGPAGVVARRALLRGVGRVHEHDGDTGQRRLVSDEGAELMEAPGFQRGPLRLPSLYPLADPPQVLQGDPTTGAFRLGHDLLGDAVVHVPGHPGFLSTAHLEQAFGALGALALEFPAEPAVAVAHAVQPRSRPAPGVGVVKDVHDAEIHAQHVGGPVGFALGDRYRRVQEPLPVPEDEVGFAPLPAQQRSLVVTTDEGDHLTPGHRPDADRIGVGDPAQDAGVVGDGVMGDEPPLHLAVQLVGVADLGDQLHDHLRRQAGRLPDVAVGDLVKVVAPEGSPRPRHVAQDTRRSIRLPEGGLQGNGLLGGGKDLDLGDQRLGHEPSMQRGTDKRAAVFALTKNINFSPNDAAWDPGPGWTAWPAAKVTPGL